MLIDIVAAFPQLSKVPATMLAHSSDKTRIIPTSKQGDLSMATPERVKYWSSAFAKRFFCSLRHAYYKVCIASWETAIGTGYPVVIVGQTHGGGVALPGSGLGLKSTCHFVGR